MIRIRGEYMYVIYLDILFLINGIMNFLIFLTVTMILNKWITLKRQFIGAIIASVLYCLFVSVPLLRQVPYSLYAWWIPVIPLLIIYSPPNIKSFIKVYFIATAIAALYGGVIFNIWYILGGDYENLHTMHLLLLIGIGVGIIICFYESFYWIRKRLLFTPLTYHITVEKDHKEIRFLALMDTGNLLYTPGTHRPVMIVTYKAIKEILDQEEREVIQEFFKTPLSKREEYLINAKKKPEFLIPFNSVGCKVGFLWGMQLEEVKVQDLKEGKVIHHCVVGISLQPLCTDQQYEGLLHPQLILEGEK